MQLVAVTKLTSASGLDSESFWAAMNAQEIPSKVELHASFTGCTATC
jgi:predicted DNA-binding transcriptional regulator AlpA